MTAAVVAGPPAWIRCGACAALLYRKRLRRNLDVCPECHHHCRLEAPERIRQLVDQDTFAALPDRVPPVDPIGFVDSLPYPHRLAVARAATGLTEAVLCGTARIGGHPVVLAVMDFRFLGGSLGSVTGELVTRAAECALAGELPLLVVTASGGARMQEGILSLMQMATVSQALAALREARLLTVSLITDPTYGGVAASFATNTDIVVAEAGARMGFAGPRVIRETVRQPLPVGFQTAEFLVRHGQVDLVVERWRLPSRLAALLAAAADGRRCRTGRGRVPVEPVWPSSVESDEVSAGSDGPGADPGGWATGDPEAARSGGVGQVGPLDAWWAVRAARSPRRPTTLDYLHSAFDGFLELHGDRIGGDCPAVVTALARLGDRQVVVIGHQKGHRPAELVARNFGMASPAGYRKALRVMRLAARLGLPVVTLVDTPGADPGIEAERNGQAAAIAEIILAMTGLPTPVLAVVTGEGGSGGALALAVADRVLALENAVYSVISPEGCAAILFEDRTAAPRAARALRLTAPDLLRLGVVDAVVGEPPGGASLDDPSAGRLLRRAVVENLTPLLELPGDVLIRRRRERFRRYGAGSGAAPVGPGAR